MDQTCSPSDVRSAYVHVPFCRHRCGYCDFTLVAKRDDLITAYLDALERELQELGRPHEVDTLFLGGGTPTHLPPESLDRLFAMLSRWLPLAAGGEFSVEGNPEGLDDPRIDCLKRAGVNRVSLGAQSFDAADLTMLERSHSPAEIASAVVRLRPEIENVSLDLIFAVPGQSLTTFRDNLQQAIALDPTHLSTYGLTFEKGTHFWTRRHKGLLQNLPDEVERSMYAAAMDDLSSAGFQHYELSNFARPNWECRHNRVYWEGGDYFGFGPGAAAYRLGVRSTRHRSVTAWIQRTMQGVSTITQVEELEPELRAREAVLLGLRLREGFDMQQFAKRFGTTLEQLEPEAWERNIANGLMELVGTRVRLTREGCFLADMVVSDFL